MTQKLEKQMNDFNKKFKVGEEVNVLTDSKGTQKDVIVHEATIMGDHTCMAWLKEYGSLKLTE